MWDVTGKYVSIGGLAAAGALAAATAIACRRAGRRGEPGSDAIVWSTLALVLLFYALTKFARFAGWLKGWGLWLRVVAREHHLYEGRRPFQIALSVAIAAATVVVLGIGIATWWEYLKRYRLAIGFAAVTIGFALVRFVSLHEVDAWNTEWPWLRVAADLTGAAGASAVALVRVRQLRTARP